MPTGPQYSDEMMARRQRVNFSVDPAAMKHAAGAWKWAYENHVTDEATFTDWINRTLTAHPDATDEAESAKKQGRMFWIDRAKAELLPAPGETPSRSEVFRAAVAAGIAEIEAEAGSRGEAIPIIDRLPSKVYRN
ncbi:hypothetical protein [Brevibacterium sp. FME17]|uniref:hypothetical protein n=1 Tax=Brevibacterium sp. FME17 TaxID=2742606 RepID=UPI001865EF2D|nr:hypothetical protein [Brevibacterium sp. FME17]